TQPVLFRPGPASTAAVVTADRAAVVLAVVVVVVIVVGVLRVQLVVVRVVVVLRRCLGGMPVRVYPVLLQLTLELRQIGAHIAILQVSGDPRLLGLGPAAPHWLDPLNDRGWSAPAPVTRSVVKKTWLRGAPVGRVPA